MLRQFLSLTYPSSLQGKQRFITLVVVAMLLSIGLSSQFSVVLAANVTVTTADDHDDSVCNAADCSLREAINAANAGDTIVFNILGGGSAQIIALDIGTFGPLPLITQQITIDGTTQTGAACNAPPITVDGTGQTGDGITITAGANASIIRGLTITNFIGNGIVLSGANNNQIQCNNIGGTSGNSGDGILISGSTGNVIGGTGNENVITGNGGAGVNIANGNGNRISENSIFSNGGLGIALTGGAGANNNQASPVLTLAQSDGFSGTTVTGTLTSTPSRAFKIEFFKCDTSADEGETLLGTIPSITVSGTTAIDTTLGTFTNIGDSVSATATDILSGNTSQFSACEPVIGQPVYQSDVPIGSLITLSTSVGVPLSANINVTNPGNETLDITATSLTGTGYTLVTTAPPTLSVNAGDTTIGVNIEVQCDATTTTGSPFLATLTVSHNAGPDATYDIQCTVAAAPVPDYDSSPLPGDPITFGSVVVGSSNTTTLVLKSVGSAPIDVTNPVFSGPDAADFSIDSGIPATIPGGGQPSAILRCTPSRVGALNATLSLDTTSSDPAETTVSYPLSCTGVPPTINLSPLTLPNTFVNFPTYSETITASGGTAPYTFAVTSGTIPSGMNFDGTTGVLDGIPDTVGTYNFGITATVTDSITLTGNQNYTLTIDPGPITVNPATLPNGMVGVAYSQNITATGGSGTYVDFSVTAGAAPGGLSLNPTTGLFDGTPTANGTFNFTITVTDSLGGTGFRPYIVVISPAITLSPASPLPNGTVGVAYNQTVTASGGSGTFVSYIVTAGTLPAGLSLAPATGAISGTPTTTGTSNFTITATDSNGATGSLAYALTIDPGPIVVSPATLPNGMVGVAYSQNITALGGSGTYVSFIVTAGTEPNGLTLNPTTGLFDGTPTANGSFTFTITVTDSLGGTGFRPYTVVISPAITLSPASPLPNGTVGTAYNQTVTASGGSGAFVSYIVTAGTLPAGLSLAPATGAISGTPTATGTSNFTITATDSNGATGSLAYALTIDPGPITVNPATLPNGTITVAYSQTITATGGSGSYVSFIVTTGTLPPGLSLNPGTGLLDGVPTTAGPYSFTITVTDSLGATGFRPYNVTISGGITVTPPTLPNGTVGIGYGQVISATGGSGVYVSFIVTAGTLPAGLSLNPTTGQLTGTPTTAGPSNFTITATDSLGATGSLAYTLTIDPAPITVNPATLLNGTVGSAYNQTITATGGSGTYVSFIVTTGTLPAGLTLDPTTGALTGTPTTVGTSNFTITVTDSNGTTGSRPYAITVDPAGTITLNPPTLPGGALTVAYNQTVTATPVLPTPNFYTYVVTLGALPNGLSLNPNTGAITGIPTQTGPFNFTITATNNGSGLTGSRAYTISISAAPAAIYDSVPPPTSIINIGTVQIGTAISFNLLVKNLGNKGLEVDPGTGGLIVGSTDFSVTSPGFPFLVSPGGSQNVTIQCVPTTAGQRTATLNFRVVNDPNRTAATYTLQCTGTTNGSVVSTATPFGFVPTATSFGGGVATATPVLPATGAVDGVKGLAMRTGPYLGATLVGKAIPGEAYDILARSNDEGGGITWYLIRTKDGVTGWVSGLYLVIVGNIDAVPFQGSIFDQIDGAPDTGIRARAMSIIDIRRRPSGRASILGQVPQGGTLILLGRTRQNGGDFWVQVNYNGIIGWIPAAPIAVNGFTSNVPIR